MRRFLLRLLHIILIIMCILIPLLLCYVLVIGVIYLVRYVGYNIGLYVKINLFAIFTLAVSIVSALFTFENFKRNRYSDKTNFRVVQNLWDPSYPRFSLVNESTRKLSVIPPHFYIMAVPSKIYWHLKKVNKTFSFLALSPFSYQVIYRQKDFLKTTGEIETSYLPKNFYIKKGIRDLVNSGIITDNKELSVSVSTLPMIVLITRLGYKYLDNKTQHYYNFVSTPIIKRTVSKRFVDDVMSYISDNSDLEIKPHQNESIYYTANKSIVHRWQNAIKHGKENQNLFEFIGAKDGEYGYVLRSLNNIISPQDPMEKFRYENYKNKL